MAGSRHPVAAELDVRQGRHRSAGQIGDGLRNRQSGGGGGIQDRHRRSLPDRHRLARVAFEVGGGDRRVGNRYLPGTHHLITGYQPRDAAIADRDEKRLVRDGWQSQDALDCLVELDVGERQRRLLAIHAGHLPSHARRFAEQHRQGHIDGRIAEVRIGQLQAPVVGRHTHDRIGTALALAKRNEALEPIGRDSEDVALLGFVAPELQRRHARLCARHGAQIEAGAATRIMHELGQRVAETSRSHVVDGDDRVVFTQRPCPVDHLLTAPLDLRVVPLHRGKIQVLLGGTLGKR